jgi:hypothetical protein
MFLHYKVPVMTSRGELRLSSSHVNDNFVIKAPVSSTQEILHNLWGAKSVVNPRRAIAPVPAFTVQENPKVQRESGGGAAFVAAAKVKVQATSSVEDVTQPESSSL